MRWAGDGPARPARMGLLIALASAVQVTEGLVPLPVPWFRLGLGNAVILAALDRGGWREGAWVAAGKVLVGGLLGGKLFSPGFWLALAGTLAATGTMGVALSAGPRLGFVGASVLGAQAHVAAQLVVAAFLLRTGAVWSLAPLLGTMGVVSGVLTGWAAHGLAGALGPGEREPEGAR